VGLARASPYSLSSSSSSPVSPGCRKKIGSSFKKINSVILKAKLNVIIIKKPFVKYLKKTLLVTDNPSRRCVTK